MALYECRFRTAVRTDALTMWPLHAHNAPIPDHGGDKSGANLCGSRAIRAIGPSRAHLLNIRLRIGFRLASRGLRAVSNRSPPHSNTRRLSSFLRPDATCVQYRDAPCPLCPTRRTFQSWRRCVPLHAPVRSAILFFSRDRILRRPVRGWSRMDPVPDTCPPQGFQPGKPRQCKPGRLNPAQQMQATGPEGLFRQRSREHPGADRTIRAQLLQPDL